MLAGAAAVAVPTFAGGLVSKIPGGAVGVAVAGAGLIFLGSHKSVDGAFKGIVVGTGAGLLTLAALQLLVGGKTATATA